MSKRRRSQTQKRAKQQLPQAAEVVAFTDVDEAFFARGTALEHAERVPAESFDDLEAAAPARPGFWRRLFV